MKLEKAGFRDAAAIAALRTAANASLTRKYGPGHWSGEVTERFVRFRMRNEHVYALRRWGKIIATLTLATKKPWAINRELMTKVGRPVYLIDMAVAPEWQRKGIGRACIRDAVRIAKAWPAESLVLDAYAAKAGAAGFYAACGFREIGRAPYKGVPLVYFERLLGRPSSSSKTTA